MEQANKWKWTHNIRKLLELQGQAMQRRMYFTFDYLQFDEDKKDFYKLIDKEDYKGILNLARELDEDVPVNLKDVYVKPKRFPGDDLLDENDEYAVVYNNRVAGNITLYRKISELDVRNLLNNDITGRVEEAYTKDVDDVRITMLEEFASSVNEDNRFLKVNYDRQEDSLSVTFISYDGNEYQVARRDYDPSLTVGENIQAICEEYKDRYGMLTEMAKEISKEKEEEESEKNEETKKVGGTIDNESGSAEETEAETEEEKLNYEETQKHKRIRGIGR